MSGKFFNDDGHPGDLDPFSERQVGERLRSALRDHADRVEPASNSYLTLSKRLEEAAPITPKRSGRGGGRFLAAAAMLVVAAGAGTYLISQARTGDLNAVGTDGAEPTVTVPTPTTTTTTPSTTQQPTTTTVAPTTTTSPPPEVVAAVVDQVRLPAAQSASGAAQDLVYLLGLPGKARYKSNGSTVDLLVPEDFESGQGPLAQVRVDGSGEGFTAVRATSETMQISEVYVDDDELVVLGQGVAFEASVQVDLIGTDGTRLASTYTTAGCCEDLMPFEARLPIRGVGEAFVVAHGDSAGSGVVSAFSAEPVSFQGLADSRTYTVFRIRPDDKDQGLNLRDLPGSDEGQILATLPPGETGIRRLPDMPALVGDSYWWHVEVADGSRGWVHSWFLTPDSSGLTADELAGAAVNAVANLNGVEYGGLDWLGLSRRVPVALGWIGDPQIVSGPRILEAQFWSDAGRWSVPEATFGEAEKTISLRSLITPSFEPEDGPQIDNGALTRYGFENDMVESYFAGTRAVTVSGPPTGDSVEDRSMVLFYEAGPTGPELVGAVASIFVP